MVVGLLVGLGALAREGREPVRRDGGELAVVEVDDLAGVADERGHIAGDVHLAVADADDQRRTVAGDDDPIGVVGVHHREAVGAVDPVEHVEHGSLQRGCGRPGDEVGDHLGVGVGGELHAVGAQLVAQRRRSCR